MSRLICKYCDHRFTHQFRYRLHLTACLNRSRKLASGVRGKSLATQQYKKRQIDEKNKRTCKICNKTFAHVNHRYRHERSIHMEVRPFACSLCPQRYGYERGLKIHISMEHKNHSAAQPKRQSSVESDSKSGSSISAQQGATGQQNGKRSRAAVEQDERTCKICNKVFSQIQHRIRHEQSLHNKDRKFVCSLCPIRCKTEFGLKGHMTLAHSAEPVTESVGKRKRASPQQTAVEDQNDRTCKVCKKVFENKQRRIHHERRLHNKQRRFVCPFCPSRFENVTALRRHNTIEHYSERASKNKSSLLSKNHQQEAAKQQNRLAAEEKNHRTCKICKKVLANKNMRERHERNLHNTERQLVCPLCSARFETVQSLKRHVTIEHSAELDDKQENTGVAQPKSIRRRSVSKAKSDQRQSITTGPTLKRKALMNSVSKRETISPSPSPSPSSSISTSTSFKQKATGTRRSTRGTSDQVRNCVNCQRREEEEAKEKEEYLASRDDCKVIDLSMEDDDEPYKYQNPSSQYRFSSLICPTCKDLRYSQFDLGHHILTDHAGISSSEGERCYGCQHWYPKGITLLTHMTTCVD